MRSIRHEKPDIFLLIVFTFVNTKANIRLYEAITTVEADMKLETFAAKKGWEIEDYADVTFKDDAAERGWTATAFYPPELNPSEYETTTDEPVFILVKSPDWPNYQVRNIFSPFASGTMLTEQQVRDFIKNYKPE